ncbi:pogo transposable element with krab domain-like, partial [Colletotrichum incanum]
LTWADKGSRIVAGKSDCSGWSKRNEITVEYNDTAYNNEYLLEKWLTNEFFPLIVGQEYLLVIDVTTFHKTPTIIAYLCNNYITPSLIPPSTTSLLQPLDTTVNKPFKQWLAEATDDYVYQLEQSTQASSSQPLIWLTSVKRIIVTYTVVTAARRLASAEKAEMVRQFFLQCGISDWPDGSDISKIRVKDIPIETVLWDRWDTFNVEKRIKEELANDPEILEDADRDNTEYISTAEDVQQPIGNNLLAPVDLTRLARPWDL